MLLTGPHRQTEGKMPTKTPKKKDSSRKGGNANTNGTGVILSSDDSHERSSREEGCPPVQLSAEQTDQFEQLATGKSRAAAKA